jgi:hypothetical protein
VTPPRSQPRPPGLAGFTLHRVTDVVRLRQLGRTMANCLATYGDRLEGRHRIVEVRAGGRTRYVVHVRAGRIVTFEAAGNRPPDPDDVPVVRALLRREGHLDATRAPAPARAPLPAPQPPASPGARQPTLDAGPVRRRAPRPRPAADAPAADGRAADGPAADRPAAGRPAGLSVQQLATDLLDPRAADPPSWTELAAALWAAGLLPRLPDPTQDAFERVVRDLARRVATGDDRSLPRVRPPTEAERTAARRRLLEGLDHVTEASWQRRRMADVLAVPLLP